MKQPLVSIMMPAFNAADYVGRAIESVLAQSYSNWELVIIDDGSSDGTGDVAASFSDPRVSLIRQPNAGEAGARNRALSLVRGQLLAFLDADDLFLPQHLETAVRFLDMHPQVGAVYTDGYYCDANDTQMERLSSRRIPPVEGRIFESLVRTSSVFGPPMCVVLRLELVRLHSLTFDPEIVIGPDWDFFIRLSDRVDFGFVTEATCLYRVHATNITVRTDSTRRYRDLARCRTKAIKMEAFGKCSPDTRQWVFYDLVVNLLSGNPSLQDEALGWLEFSQLTTEDQSRLLRLTAADGLRRGVDRGYIEDWLRRSRSHNSRDAKGALLWTLYRLSPGLCSRVVRWKYGPPEQSDAKSPFDGIGISAARR